jgi:predicted nucleotidyltransferase
MNNFENGFDYEAAKRFQREKEEKRNNELDKRFECAWSDFNNIIKMLIEKYNPKKIYQWGSLLDRRIFSEISDIDIALEDIKSAEEFFSIYKDAEEITNFPLDLIEIDKIEPLYAEDIRKKGKLVYERKQ